jgi:hypothetical protein
LANYLADDDGEYRKGKYAAQLCLFLHRVFKDEGYTSFVGLVDINRVRTDDGAELPFYRLITHQARFIGSMTEAWRYLWLPGDQAKEAAKLQLNEEMNHELRMLFERWSIKISLPLGDTLQPVEFHYDHDARHIEIGPAPIQSTDPSDYPEKLRKTSEVLSFVAAMQSAKSAVYDLAPVRSFYPLFKLWHQMIEKNSWTVGNFRVSAADSEDWDYFNPDADREIGNYDRAQE